MRKNVEYKQITKEVVTYVADDGEIFNSEEECNKYEQTAKFAINAAFNKLELQRNEYVGDRDPFCMFGGEDDIVAVKVKNANDVEIINKWIASCYDAKCKSELLIGADAIGTIQLFCIYDFGNEIWRIGTPEELKKMFADGIDKLVDKLILKETKEEN